MNIANYFTYWGIDENPFQAEEARDDVIYQRIMTEDMTHPDFEKIYGSPVRPSTSVVFGEKGSGKTAIRLLIEKRLKAHNERTPESQVWVVNYDNLNPILDTLERLKSEGKTEGEFRLVDHQDAILSMAVTRLVDFLVNADDLGLKNEKKLRKGLRKMSRQKRLDLVQLVAIYDQPTKTNAMSRWNKVKNFLRIGKVMNITVLFWTMVVSFGLLLAGVIAVLMSADPLSIGGTAAMTVIFLLSGFMWISETFTVGRLMKKIEKEVRVVERQPNELKLKLSDLSSRDLQGQPVPVPGDQDSRYELTARFLRIIQELNFRSMTVLVDRVDEPVLVNGNAEHMRGIIWPMLNNKFLQQDNVGFKLLLPIELSHMLRKEGPDFYQQARLDKQNMVEKLEWTGATLYDIASRRLKACLGKDGKVERLTDLFDDDVTSSDLIDALDQMNQPRDAFKFLYAVVQEHCNNTSDDSPNYKIPKLLLDQIRKQQSQRVQNLYRGLGPA
ncbi:MAG: hypothetical protein ACI9TH_004275 [Kiritimatiellia bacterium]|jgi:hypothetical protein